MLTRGVGKLQKAGRNLFFKFINFLPFIVSPYVGGSSDINTFFKLNITSEQCT